MSANDTMNNVSHQCGFPADPSIERAWKTFAYCVIGFGSLLGNFLVILIIFKIRGMRSTINYFILNMAASDVLFTVFVIPRVVSDLHSAPFRWFVGGVLGSFLCKLDFFIQDVSTAVSILSLVAIAVDRFYGVVFPMKAGLMSSGTFRRRILAATWFVSALFHLPYFYAYKLYDDALCVYNWSPFLDHEKTSTVYFLIMSITLFFFPAIILIIVYSIIIITLKRQKFPGNQSVKDKKRVAKRNRSVLRMVVAVVIVFICCWLPFNVSTYIALFRWGSKFPCHASSIFFWVVFIAYSNGCISPCLYFIFNENFRQGFGKVFFRGGTRGSIRSNLRSTRRRTDDISLSTFERERQQSI